MLGERLFFDISSPLTPILVEKVLAASYRRQYWLCVESDMKNMMLGFIKELKSRYDINMKYARCDNARKNKDCEKACK